MKTIAFAATVAAFVAGAAMADSQLHQQAQMAVDRHGLHIQIPEDTDPAKLEEIIQVLEREGANRTEAEARVNAILE